jgi:hypothetical protein
VVAVVTVGSNLWGHSTRGHGTVFAALSSVWALFRRVLPRQNLAVGGRCPTAARNEAVRIEGRAVGITGWPHGPAGRTARLAARPGSPGSARLGQGSSLIERR